MFNLFNSIKNAVLNLLGYDDADALSSGIAQRHDDEPICEISITGTKHWFLNGKLHCLDGPAMEYYDGGKRWYLNGKLHREDGPAIEYSNGSKHWYLHGKKHRLDGPAAEWTDGTKSWYIDGKRHTFKQWLEYVWDTLSIEQQEKYIFNGFEDAE